MKSNSVIDIEIENGAPIVPLWKTWGLRIFFAGLVFVIGKWQLMSILGGLMNGHHGVAWGIRFCLRLPY